MAASAGLDHPAGGNDSCKGEHPEPGEEEDDLARPEPEGESGGEGAGGLAQAQHPGRHRHHGTPDMFWRPFGDEVLERRDREALGESVDGGSDHEEPQWADPHEEEGEAEHGDAYLHQSGGGEPAAGAGHQEGRDRGGDGRSGGDEASLGRAEAERLVAEQEAASMTVAALDTEVQVLPTQSIAEDTVDFDGDWILEIFDRDDRSRGNFADIEIFDGKFFDHIFRFKKSPRFQKSHL